MAFQSVWYYTDLPEDIVDIIERDVSETFDEQMGDSKLHGDSLNKEKRNSQNAWIPTTHWVGGFLWHYIQRANRENFLYDLRNIDGESMQYTRYGEGQFYGWHNDAGLATASQNSHNLHHRFHRIKHRKIKHRKINRLLMQHLIPAFHLQCIAVHRNISENIIPARV